jgi:sugar phosphate isomerase/epimerase
MKSQISRRSFVASLAVSPLLVGAVKKSPVPVGLELYSVRDELQKDLMGTVRAVAEMGYQGVEFYGPYFEWTTDYARKVRKHLDDLGIVCFSTHNDHANFRPDKIDKAIELNQIIGSRMIVMASAGRVEGLDGWKKIADLLNQGAAKMKPAGISAGFHNHEAEFTPVEGKLPLEVLAANTKPEVVLQLDVGTCLKAGRNPVAWIQQNPGRLRSIHCKDWSPDPGKGYEVLLGEGAAPWKQIFAAAERVGGVEYYLVEQEGSRFPPLETAKRCLAEFRRLHS